MEEREVVLKTNGLTKRYGTNEAVSNVNMTVKKGDIYGFVGLNGSGKTTLIRLITGLIKPSGGNFALFDGKPNETVSAMKRISSMVETPSLYMNLPALDNLKLQCDFCSIKDDLLPGKLLELVGLHDTGKKRVKDFSLGMRQRLGIAVCLVGSPEFLILDEPTNGLDPEGIIEIRELLKRLNSQLNITILVASHILSELSKLATVFGFIHRGKLIKEISNNELHSSVESKIIMEVDDLPSAAKAVNGVYGFAVNSGKLELVSDAPLSDIVSLMQTAGVKVYSANKVSQDLESYFMNLIGGYKR